MALLEFIGGLVELYLILIAGPRAAWRWTRRLRSPTEVELAVSRHPEMTRFRRGWWTIGIGWAALSLVGGIASGSLWYGLIGILIGLMLIPGLVERRYDRLVAELSVPKAP